MLFNWIDSFPFLVFENERLLTASTLGAFNLWSSLTVLTSGFACVLSKVLWWLPRPTLTFRSSSIHFRRSGNHSYIESVFGSRLRPTVTCRSSSIPFCSLSVVMTIIVTLTVVSRSRLVTFRLQSLMKFFLMLSLDPETDVNLTRLIASHYGSCLGSFQLMVIIDRSNLWICWCVDQVFMLVGTSHEAFLFQSVTLFISQQIMG